ncbi:MAG: hypothetical protein A2Y72_02210 [Chloroflexi bacterium RBG_13_53_26]|nr:MAG: hypothetical protein A2Y72_02210 [Chloroflexi bacterium RBG_13_53_26]
MAVKTLTRETHAQRLADYLPGGRLFSSRNIASSNLRKFLLGLAHEMTIADGHLCNYQNDIAPSVTTYFIDEWEKALGIPDSCLTGTGALVERRRDVVLKLAALGVQTVEDFVYIGSLFGITVTVESFMRHSEFPLIFPLYLVPSGAQLKFTILVSFTVAAVSRFPLTFPFTLGDSAVTVLECLFRRLKPANCDIIFQQV